MPFTDRAQHMRKEMWGEQGFCGPSAYSKALLHCFQGGRSPRTSAWVTHSVEALLQKELCLVVTTLQRHRELTKESEPARAWIEAADPPPTLTQPL